MKDRLILLYVPTNERGGAQGGQVTASEGLIEYLSSRRSKGFKYVVVNTSPTNNYKYKLINKAHDLVTRIRILLKHQMESDVDVVLFFNSGFLALFERAILSYFVKKKSAKTAVFFRNSNFESYFKYKFTKSLFRYLLSRFDLCLVQGERLRYKLIAFGNTSNRIEVIPNWLQPSFSNTLLENTPIVRSENSIRFIFTGRFIKEKGLYILLHAFLLLSKRYDNIYLTLVGEGVEKTYIENYISMNNLNHCVTLAGWQSQSSLIKLMLKHDVFVFPTSHPEGMPNSLIEAMALGMPALATDVGAISDIVEPGVNGYIVNNDSESIAACMEYYCREPNLIQSHGENARSSILAKHGYEKNCQKLLDLLLSI